MLVSEMNDEISSKELGKRKKSKISVSPSQVCKKCKTDNSLSPIESSANGGGDQLLSKWTVSVWNKLQTWEDKRVE